MEDISVSYYSSFPSNNGKIKIFPLQAALVSIT